MVTEEKILQAKSVFKSHLGPDLFNEDGWRYILEHHGGRLPLRIKAVPEGSIIPVKNGVCVCLCLCVCLCVSTRGLFCTVVHGTVTCYEQAFEPFQSVSGLLTTIHCL